MDNQKLQKQQNDQNILNRFLSSKSARDERPNQMNINSSSLSIKSEMNIGGGELNRQFMNNFSASIRSSVKKPEPDPVVSEINVQVRLRSNDKEDWIREIKVTLIATFTSSNKMSVNLNLTDDQDPLFLYSVDIGETEFHALKNEQSLHIDFQQFPMNLFEMLEKCNSVVKGEEYNNNYNSYSQKGLIGNSMGAYSNFVAIIQFVNINEAILLIQENNTFRSLSHLSIKFKQASDFQLKNYLSSVIKEIKEKNDNLLRENLSMKEKLDLITINLKKRDEDFKKLQDSHNLEVTSTRNECVMELNAVREKLVIEYQSLLDSKEKEKNADIKFLQEQLNKIKDEKERLIEDYRSLDDLRKSLENNLKETNSQFELSKRDLASLKEELGNLRSQNKNLDQTKFSQEKNITEYSIKLELLVKQLEEKDSNVRNLKQMIDQLQVQKAENDETIKTLKISNSKLEGKLSETAAEINKGNEIIKKIQNDLKVEKKLKKAKEKVAQQNDQLVIQKQNQIDELTKIFNDMKRDLDRKEDEVKILKSSYEEQKEVVKKQSEQIQENINVISFLNQKLNDNNSITKNFNNILNFNANNLTSGIGSGSSLSYTNQIKTNMPETNKYEVNSDSFKEIQAKNQVMSNLNSNYKMNNIYSTNLENNNTYNLNSNTNLFGSNNNLGAKDNLQSSTGFIKPLTNFSEKYKNDTLGSNINTNFFELNKISNNYTPLTMDNNFTTTSNLTSMKYGAGIQNEPYTKGTSLTNQKYGNSIKLTQYLNSNNEVKLENSANNSIKERDSKFEDEEEQPRPYVSLGSKNKK